MDSQTYAWIAVGASVLLVLIIVVSIALKRWFTVEQGSVQERDVEIGQPETLQETPSDKDAKPASDLLQ